MTDNTKYSPLDDDHQDGNIQKEQDYESHLHHHHKPSFLKSNKFKVLLVIIAVITIALIAGIVFFLTQSGSKSKDQFNLSPKWDADFNLGIELNGENLTGHIYMDTDNEQFRVDVLVVSIIYRQRALYTVVSILNQCQYNITNFGPNITNPFDMYFNWTYVNTTKYTNDQGVKTSCDLFNSKENGGIYFSICLENGENIVYIGYTNTTDNESKNVDFYNFQANQLADNAFKVPKGCQLNSNITINEMPTHEEKQHHEHSRNKRNIILHSHIENEIRSHLGITE